MDCILTLGQFEEAAAATNLPLEAGGVVERLRGDLPLRCITTACVVFWA